MLRCLRSVNQPRNEHVPPLPSVSLTTPAVKMRTVCRRPSPPIISFATLFRVFDTLDTLAELEPCAPPRKPRSSRRQSIDEAYGECDEDGLHLLCSNHAIFAIQLDVIVHPTSGHVVRPGGCGSGPGSFLGINGV